MRQVDLSDETEYKSECGHLLRERDLYKALAEELAAALKNTLSQLLTMTHTHPDDEINNFILAEAEAAIAKYEQR